MTSVLGKRYPPGARIVHHRVGGWLPKNQDVLEAWIARKLAIVNAPQRRDKPFSPVIQEFQNLIESDAELWMEFHLMFEQVPIVPPYNNDPTGVSQIRNYIKMLMLFDEIITTAPQFEDNDLVGFPINAILDWPMGTTAGMSAFSREKLNAQFKRMFDVWSAYLVSPASRSVLTTDVNGWFGPLASEAMPNFAQTYVCDPTAEFYGFQSWDNFFTRLFRDGKRPVQFADIDSIVNNGCESTVYKIAYHIKERDTFWIKSEPYSLYHMLDNHEYAPQFVGGTVYQAFLSALKYHRWHSPVNGEVVKTAEIPGTYYLESPAHGFASESGPDPAAPNLSQSFITSTAARVLIFIKAKNPIIGLMCFIAVGMAEVSTCEVTVKDGDIIKKGDQLGMFHFGGSTHCLLFRPETLVTFDPKYDVGADVELNVGIATVKTPK